MSKKKAANMEGFNLLAAESSDSEGQEHFDLPPLNLKSNGKKKGAHLVKAATKFKTKPNSRGCCAPCVAVGVLILIILGAVVTVLSVYTYNLKKQVDNLIEISVQTGNKENPQEFQDIHSKQKELEDRLDKFKTGNQGLEQLSKNITSLLAQVKLLNETTQDLHKQTNSIEKSFAEASAIQSLPKTVDRLSKSVTDFGSELAGMQNSVDGFLEFKTKISKRVDDLSDRLESELVQGPDSEVTSGEKEGSKETESQEEITKDMKNELTEKIAAMGSVVQKINETLSGKIAQIITNGAHHEEMISKLQNQTVILESRVSLLELSRFGSSSTTAVNSNQSGSAETSRERVEGSSEEMQAVITQSVQNVMQELKNYTQDEVKLAQKSLFNNLTTQVEQLWEFTHAIESQVLVMKNTSKSNSPGGSQQELNEFIQQYQAQVNHDINTINATLYSTTLAVTGLGEDLSDIASRVYALEYPDEQDLGPEEPTDNVQPTSTTEAPKQTTATTGRQYPDWFVPPTEGPKVTTKRVPDDTDKMPTTITEAPSGGKFWGRKTPKTSTTVQTLTTERSSSTIGTNTEKQWLSSSSSTTTTPSGGDKSTMSTTPADGEAKPSSTTPKDDEEEHVSVDFIKNLKDLRVNFARWNMKTGNGQVTYEDMVPFLGPLKPDKAVLSQYDENRDGYYTFEEIVKAFGFEAHR